MPFGFPSPARGGGAVFSACHAIIMSRCFAATAAFFLCALVSMLPSAFAADDDTRFLLDRVRRVAERQGRGDTLETTPPGTIRHQGQVYTVNDRLEELEPAIYIALNSGQWERLLEFVGRYRQLSQHRPALVKMAEGLLAREAGDYRRALRQMHAAQGDEPGDLRIALELARLQFEDNQDNAARSGFRQVLSTGVPADTQAMLQQYLAVLDQRQSWHGSLAFGFGRNDNINQANGDYTCFLDISGMCLFERKMPDPMASNLLHYDWAVQRRLSLRGNHNLQFRAAGYGSQYRHEDGAENRPIHDYSQHTAVAYMGYQYLRARDSFTASPYIESYLRDGHGEYVAPGLQLEWRRALGRRWQVGSLLDARRYRYTHQGQRLSADFSYYQWGGFVGVSLGQRTWLHGGLDIARKKYPMPQASTREAAVRGGMYHLFAGKAGVYVNATGIFRLTRADAYDGFLDARRRDRQQVYIATLGVNAWKVAGLIPELRFKRSVNNANPYWAMGFEQNELGLMLRRDF